MSLESYGSPCDAQLSTCEIGQGLGLYVFLSRHVRVPHLKTWANFSPMVVSCLFPDFLSMELDLAVFSLFQMPCGALLGELFVHVAPLGKTHAAG